VPNTPASGSPHTEDSRHPIPHWTLWRVSFGTGEAKRSFDGKTRPNAVSRYYWATQRGQPATRPAGVG